MLERNGLHIRPIHKIKEGRPNAVDLVITSIAGAQAAVNAIESIKKHKLEVRSLQDYHPHYAKTAGKPAAV